MGWSASVGGEHPLTVKTIAYMPQVVLSKATLKKPRSYSKMASILLAGFIVGIRGWPGRSFFES
jgi:hypothetical protein